MKDKCILALRHQTNDNNVRFEILGVFDANVTIGDLDKSQDKLELSETGKEMLKAFINGCHRTTLIRKTAVFQNL